MQLEPIRAVLTADSAQFVNGMNRAQGSLGNLTRTSAQSHKAMNVLKSGMVGLATQATGTTGPVSKLAQGLLLFGGGSTLVLAVAAGIGALALAYRSFTADTRANEQAQKDLLKALEGVGVHAQLTAARIKLGQAREALGATDVSQKGVFSRMLDVFRSEGQRETERQAALRAVANAENEVATAAKDVAKWQAQIAADAERERSARERSLMALDKMIAKVPSKESVERFTSEQQAKLLGIGGKHGQGALGPLNELGGKMRYGLEQAGISENMRDFGISVGRQFAMGMLEGIQSMKDLFKMVLMSILDFGLGVVLNSIIPGSGATVGGIKGQAVAPASMNLNMNMSGLQPLTAFAIARDPGFQQVIREATLVAASQGFRGAK